MHADSAGAEPFSAGSSPDSSSLSMAEALDATSLFGVPRMAHQSGDTPSPRFGHTSTYVDLNQVVVFGGAVGSAGGYTITNDCFSLDLNTGRWRRIPAENPPPPRAAHAACCVESLQLLVFGGATGGGSLSAEEVYLLDLRREPQLQWLSVPIQGPTPGRRYGHVMVYVQPFVVVHGGNDGARVSPAGVDAARSERPLSDVWCLDVDSPPFQWTEIDISPQARRPTPRAYHAAAVCREGPATGMMVLFGGREQSGRSLNDAWGLRRHRNKTWDWVAAPCKKQLSPEPRFQHSVVFVGTRLVVLGGRSDSDCSKALSTAVYDTESVEWRFFPTIGRFRHSSWGVRGSVFIFGGFSHTTQQHPTCDLMIADYGALGPSSSGLASEKEREESVKKTQPSRSKQQTQPQLALPTQQPSASAVSAAQQQPRNAALARGAASAPPTAGGPCAAEGILSSASSHLPPSSQLARQTLSAQSLRLTRPSADVRGSERFALEESQHPSASLFAALHSARRGSARCAAQIRLSSHVAVVQEQVGDFSSHVRRISIDRLEEEGRKINKATTSSAAAVTAAAVEDSPGAALAERILKVLLRPLLTHHELETFFHTEAPFCIPWKDVAQLCDYVTDILRDEDMVLSLRAPIKVYGDLHGQYYDMMRLFGLYKMPVREDEAEEFAARPQRAAAAAQNGAATASVPTGTSLPSGDLDSNDYLFLGDYVDRGAHSLEVICLLFALKLKYPLQVHLIRGNHEDRSINSMYGFQEECRRRLSDDVFEPHSVWARFNLAFDFMPVAALVDDKVLCLHGGIGGSIDSVLQLKSLQRPLKVPQVPTTLQEQQVTDLLWSDPTESDSVLGVSPNEIRDPDGSGRICRFGPDRVYQFLRENNLQLIIRAHECVMDGFERFAGGKLITLFSATNYCNHHQNAGALLFIRRDLTIVPKLIYPASAPALQSTWDERMTELRPPTPPRAPPRIRGLGIEE